MKLPSLLAALAAVLSFSTQAAWVQLTSNPATWRLENYPNDQVAIWHTDSTCSHGHVYVPTGFTAADVNRLWAVVTVAKTTGKKLFMYYENTNSPTLCPIASFGLDVE